MSWKNLVYEVIEMLSDLHELIDQETKRAELSKKVFQITKQVMLEQARQNSISEEELLKLQKTFVEQEEALDKKALQRKQEIESI